MVKKDKTKKYSFQWYEEMLCEIRKDTGSYIVNEKLYNEIYQSYKFNKNLDLNIERITLKSKIRQYHGTEVNINLQLMVLAFILLISEFIQLAGSVFQLQIGALSAIVSFVISMLIIFFLINDRIKSKSKEKELICNISLQVLENIEKEATTNNSTDGVVQADTETNSKNENNNGKKNDDHRQRQINGIINIVFNKKINLQKENGK